MLINGSKRCAALAALMKTFPITGIRSPGVLDVYDTTIFLICSFLSPQRTEYAVSTVKI